MNYDFTLGELLDKLEKAASTLKGKNPLKEKGLGEMIDRVVEDLDLDLEYYNIVVKDCEIFVDTIDFGEIEIITFRPEYKPDKRKRLGKGDYLQEVKVVLTREIPLDLELINLTQILSYDIAEKYKESTERKIKELYSSHFIF